MEPDMDQPPEDDRHIWAILRKRVPEVRFQSIQFQNGINFMRDILQVTINPNWGAMEQLGITRNTELTLQLRDVRAETALREILSTVAGREDVLDFVVHEGVIKISTLGDLATTKYVVVYDISDLTSPREPESADRIVEMFRVMVLPDSWAPHGDAALYRMGELVVIRHHVRAHRELAKLFRQLRYAKSFGEPAEKIFAGFKVEVDLLIADHCGEVLEKIPSIVDRLAQGDSEAISHALLTCRRIITVFADLVYPPREGTVSVSGEDLAVGKDKQKNRLLAYVDSLTGSKERKRKLKRMLFGIWDRVSDAVHNDVTWEEARVLFLETYYPEHYTLNISRPRRNGHPHG